MCALHPITWSWSLHPVIIKVTPLVHVEAAPQLVVHIICYSLCNLWARGNFPVILCYLTYYFTYYVPHDSYVLLCHFIGLGSQRLPYSVITPFLTFSSLCLLIQITMLLFSLSSLSPSYLYHHTIHAFQVHHTIYDHQTTYDTQFTIPYMITILPMTLSSSYHIWSPYYLWH